MNCVTSLRIAVKANLRSKLSAQRGRSHNPRVIESRLQGYIV
jgi:hypothetical protein